MLKIFIGFIVSVVLSFIIMTALFLFFGYHGISGLWQDFLITSQGAYYWLGIGIFSILFFVFFALPIALMLIKESMATA